jgi:mannose-6-phosphate isomerase
VPLYPLLFEPIYKQKVWGGRALEKFGRVLPGEPDALIGESWELADLLSTSASGGGGEAARSTIANGPLKGQTLGRVIGMHGQNVCGELIMTPEGTFPLLVKFLDARQNLSVQVHPSEAYASEHADAHLKSEAWYILDADPGALIYKGVVAGTTPEAFAQAIRNNTVEDLMIAMPAKRGDCHYLPSGTCHALGAGILVAEVQTPSDTTYRVYDWGREGRELHITEALACIEFGPAQTSEFEPLTTIQRDQTTLTTLVRCDYFQIDQLKARAGYGEDLAAGEPVIWMVLEGHGQLMCQGGGCDTVDFAAGQTLLLPASLDAGQWVVAEDTTILRVSFPQINGQMA